MSPIRSQYRPVAFWAASLLVCTLIAGCQEQPTANRSPKPKRSPKESFERFVGTLRHDVEKPYINTSPGLGARSDEIATFRHSSKLKEELFPPNEEHEMYTARITVTTSVTYAAARPLQPSKDKEKKQEGRDPLGAMEATVGGDATDRLAFPDPLTTTTPSDTTASKPDPSDDSESGKPMVRSTQDSSEEVIELIYKDERWETVSEIETEWLRNEVERALRYQ